MENKIELLEKIKNYEDHGYKSHKYYNIDTPIEELLLEINAIRKKIFENKTNELIKLVELCNDHIDSEFKVNIIGSIVDAFCVFCKNNSYNLSHADA
jgi:hypothetical protein